MTEEANDKLFIGEFLTRLGGAPLEPFTTEKDVHQWVTRIAESCMAKGDSLRVLCEGRDLAGPLVRIVATHLFGGSFWPDMVVVRGDARSPVIGVEAKLLKAQSESTAISSAIGQALAYRYGRTSLPDGRGYPVALALVIDDRTKDAPDASDGDAELAIREMLSGVGVHVLVRRK